MNNKTSISQNYYVGPSKIQGKGVFAAKNFSKGGYIGKLHKIIPNKDYDYTELGRLYNHSDNPNALNVLDNNMTRHLISLREIKHGEELTADYRLQPDLEQPEGFQAKNGRQLQKAQTGNGERPNLTVKKRKGKAESIGLPDSTHLMQHEKHPETGEWIAFPLIFQNEAGEWMNFEEKNLNNGWWDNYQYALKRNEVYGPFENEADAARFAINGTWKNPTMTPQGEYNQEGFIPYPIENDLQIQQPGEVKYGGSLPKAQFGKNIIKKIIPKPNPISKPISTKKIPIIGMKGGRKYDFANQEYIGEQTIINNNNLNEGIWTKLASERTHPVRYSYPYSDMMTEYSWLDNASKLSDNVIKPYNPVFNSTDDLVSFEMDNLTDYMNLSVFKSDYMRSNKKKWSGTEKDDFKFKLNTEINKLHDNGLFHLDLHEGNVLVKPSADGKSILDFKLIDPAGFPNITKDFTVGDFKEAPALRNRFGINKNTQLTSDDIFKNIKDDAGGKDLLQIEGMKTGGSLPKAQDGVETDAMKTFRHNRPIYDVTGRCLYEGCSNREYDATHDFSVGLGFGLGKQDQNYMGDAKLWGGYSFNPEPGTKSFRGSQEGLAGYLGANIGGSMILPEDVINTGEGDPEFKSFANAVATLGLKREWKPKNDYLAYLTGRDTNPLQLGLGAYYQHPLMGDQGPEIGGYANIGNLNFTAGYIPNQGMNYGFGFGLPIREDGGQLPKAQLGGKKTVQKLIPSKKTITDIISKPVNSIKNKINLFNYNRSTDLFGNSGSVLSKDFVRGGLNNQSNRLFNNIENTGDIWKNLEDKPFYESLLSEYTAESAPFKNDVHIMEHKLQSMTNLDGSPILTGSATGDNSLWYHQMSNMIDQSRLSSETPITLTRNIPEDYLRGAGGLYFPYSLGDLKAALKSGETLSLGDISSFSAGTTGKNQFGTTRFIDKDFNTNIPAVKNTYNDNLNFNTPNIREEREILLNSPQFKVQNINTKSPRTTGVYWQHSDGIKRKIPFEDAIATEKAIKQWKLDDPGGSVQFDPAYGIDIGIKIIKKKGGEFETSLFNNNKLKLSNPDNLIKKIARLGGFTNKFQKGGENILDDGYTIKKEFDVGREMPYINYKSEPNIDGRIYYDKDSVDDPYDFNIVDVASIISKKSKKHNRTKTIIEKYENNYELSPIEYEHLNSLGLLD